jgi:hypothetical protein
MTRPTRIEVNCTTGEVNEIELTDKEIAELEDARVTYEAAKAEEETNAKLRAEQKAGLLKRLGITAEEAELLLA